MLSVFGRLSLEWIDPMRSIMQALNIFALDVRILRTDCFGRNPIIAYVVKLLFVPAVVALLIIIHFIMLLIFKITVNKAGLCNTIGGAINVMFVGLCLMSLPCFVAWQRN